MWAWADWEELVERITEAQRRCDPRAPLLVQEWVEFVAELRLVFAEGEEHFKGSGEKEARVLLLDAWRDMGAAHGDEDRIALVAKRMPKRLKKKRPVRDEAGEEVGWEEYYDYTFPEEEKKAPNLKILEMAQLWKKRKAEGDPEAD